MSSVEPPHYRIMRLAWRLKREGYDVISMALGDPEVDTDIRVIDALREGALKGLTHYGDAHGIPLFRETASQYLNDKLGTEFKPENIITVTGSKSAIYMSLKTLGGDSSRVLVIEPTWGIYYSFIRDLGFEAVPVRLRMEDGWQLREDLLEGVDRCDFIAVINPSNPTGTILDRESMDVIVEYARRWRSIIIADEIYFDLIYGSSKFYTFHSYDYDRIIGLYSLSKSHAMTGFRIGWVASYNRDLLEKIAAGYQLLLTNVPEFIQYAGAKALEYRDIVDRNREIYARRTRYLASELEKLGFKFIMPEAGIYIFSRIPEGYKDSIEFAERLLKQVYLAVAPGHTFGDYPEYVRFTTALKEETLRKAVDRLRKVLNQ